MRCLLLLFAIFKIALSRSSCPDGFDLVNSGQCRGLRKTMLLDWDERAVNTAIEKCEQIGALPVSIRNDEQQAYWQERGWLVIGLVCGKGESKWKWSDGTPLAYRPPRHDPALYETCKGGCSWRILENGYWDLVCNGNELLSNIYCTAQLRQPKPSADGCDAFKDDRNDGICFQVGKTASDFKEAQQICRSFGGFVASIHSEQENSFVRRLAVSQRATNGVFLGGSVATNGQSKWIDGSIWNYSNFKSGYPKSGLGECLVMDTKDTSGQWVNVDCNSKQAVACERKQNYTEPVCYSGPYREGDIIYSPGYPLTASTPCDFLLSVDDGKTISVEILFLEANSCCDKLVLTDNYVGGNVIATLTGEINDKVYTSTTNMMRVSWQPNGGVNVQGMMLTFRGVQ